MISFPVTQDPSGGNIEKFKEALLEDKRRKLEKIRVETEHEISEMIVEKRLSVEKRVAGLRQEQQQRYETLLKSQMTMIRHTTLEHVGEYSRSLLEELEQNVFSFFSTILQDEEKYRDLLCFLYKEASNKIDGAVVVQVEPGHGHLLEECSGDVHIIEKETGSFGGCTVFSEDKRHLIDNTLVTRWNKIKSDYMRRISIYIIEKVYQIPELNRQL